MLTLRWYVRRSSLWLALAFISLVIFEPVAIAAPEEIQVYMDDLSDPGSFGADIHNNYVFSGHGSPPYPGAQPPLHVYRLTPEFYYGLSRTLELGLYVLGSRGPDGQSNLDGGKLRLKYIAPHDETRGSFWGANLEIGKTNLRVSEEPWNTQLKGIYGYRAGPWTFAINANLDWPGAGVVRGPASLEIDGKVAYRMREGYQIGLESYNELGTLGDLGRLGHRSQTLYAALDMELGKVDLNAGIGRGLNPESDRWLLKFILGFRF